MKKWFYFLLFLFAVSCQQQESKPYTYYYWRTHLTLNEVEKSALNKADIPYLYTRFFDIEKVNGKFQPVGVITKSADFKTDKEIVPVVFIKNDVFYDITLEEINFLATNIFSLIKKKQSEFGLKVSKEIQIDCDWTAGTNKQYFHFLEKLKEISGKEITCTLRLHQVKNSKLSGYPPVSKVYLMCYSTSSPLENSTKNSLLEVEILKDYLKNIEKYPIAMDVALPIYSWGIVTNHVGKHKLINALSIKDLENPNFKKLSEHSAEILKDGFYFGTYLNKGFTIKVEEIPEKDLTETLQFIDRKLNKSFNVVYYHLDSKFTGNYDKFLN